MKRVWIIIGAILAMLLVLVVGVGAFFWYVSGQPLYEPGMVRAGDGLRAPLAPPPQNDNPDFWQVENDIALYHFTAGEGQPTLVIHGGPGRPYREPWPGLDRLTSTYTFAYYDQRGCGKSTRPIERFAASNYIENVHSLDTTLGLGAQIADIERIRQILGEERLILIGHSFGGFLASLYAAEFPEHVTALILVAPADVLVMPNDGGLFTQIEERLPEDQRAAYADWLQRYFDYGTIFTRNEAELAALNDEFATFYAAITSDAIPEGGAGGGWMTHAMYFSMGQRHDYRPALSRVTAPVLVLHGANDLQPEAASRAYAEAFPNAQFQVIADAGHFPFYTQPDAFGAEVETFLSAIDTSVRIHYANS